ncbi:MAG: hypothetical protein HZA53_18815 [Planctomycetes bacterium]|nr:hypothetical protein [Planctomycetota bacterium]
MPAGYCRSTGRSFSYTWSEEAREALARTGYGPESDGALSVSTVAGRRPLFALTAGKEQFLVRRFSHGGLLRWITGRRFLDPRRPERELVLAARLAALAIGTPTVVAARARRAPLFGWELDLVTREVADAVDLGRVLGLAREGAVSHATLRVLCAALGVLVGRMHAAGFVHADLTPNNVLVNRSALSGAAPELVVLDLDRSRFAARLEDGERRDNLRRLLRFVERRERHGKLLSRTDYARFFLGYDRGGAGWKDDWRAIRDRHARRAVWHRVGWWLERLFTARVDDREQGGAGR